MKNERKTLSEGFVSGRPIPYSSFIDTPEKTYEVIESGAVNLTISSPLNLSIFLPYFLEMKKKKLIDAPSLVR